MKNKTCLLLSMAIIAFTAQAAAQGIVRPGRPINTQTTISARMLRPEAPIRCSLDANSREISSTIPVRASDFSVSINPHAMRTPTFPVIISVPPSRQVMLAMADALRGQGVHDLMFDWQNNRITTQVDRPTADKIVRLVRGFAGIRAIVAYDISLFRVYPSAGIIDYTMMVRLAGADSVLMQRSGTLGRTLVTTSAINRRFLNEFLTSSAFVSYVSTGMFFAPSGFLSDFSLGQCSWYGVPEDSLSLTAKGTVSGGMVFSDIKVNGRYGQITNIDVMSGMDNNILVVGLPMAAIDPSQGEGELVLLISPRVINLVQKEVEEVRPVVQAPAPEPPPEVAEPAPQPAAQAPAPERFAEPAPIAMPVPTVAWPQVRPQPEPEPQFLPAISPHEIK
ncbi:MAG: hypothetical protein FWF01_02245 [Alphaproteobacteria bacterium]|nr:hypothetical protein [Alphaproteobacteria bacterium]